MNATLHYRLCEIQWDAVCLITTFISRLRTKFPWRHETVVIQDIRFGRELPREHLDRRRRRSRSCRDFVHKVQAKQNLSRLNMDAKHARNGLHPDSNHIQNRHEDLCRLRILLHFPELLMSLAPNCRECSRDLVHRSQCSKNAMCTFWSRTKI